MFLSFQLLLFPFILIFILLLFLIPFKWLSSVSKIQKNQPPSPRKFPIIGNLHQLGSSPPHSLQALTQKHGSLMLIHLGSVPVLVVSSAEAAREIFKTHDLIFSSRPKLNIPDKLTYGSKDIGFCPYGEYWRQVRSIAVLHVLNQKQVQSFRQVREQEIAFMINTIKENSGSVVDLSELTVSLTNNIICRVALGRTYKGFNFKHLLARFQNLLGVVSVGSYIPWLSWVDWLRGLDRRTKKIGKEFDEFLEGVIEEHVKKNTKVDDVDGGNDHCQDFVDILLDVQKENTAGFTFTRDTIKAIILDVFTGGTDTTSTNIEWALSELVRHPEVMKELQKEITNIAQGRSMITEDDTKEMPYLKAVLKETLRLHTPLPLLIPRESTQYVKLLGYDIAQGTQVMINAWAIARDPSIWEEPEKFKPERFLNSSIDYKGLHFEFLPFGAGRRGCPGIQFAIVINELTLANIVYKYDLALPNEGRPEELDMSEVSGLTFHKKSPLLVVATPRL